MQIHMKTRPRPFGRVLEQKLFRMVDLLPVDRTWLTVNPNALTLTVIRRSIGSQLGFDLSPD